MKIVHIELPRIFTLSVKEYMTGAAELLEAAGHRFEQYDINPNFWKWLLGLSTPHSPGDLFEPVVAAQAGDELWRTLAELKAHLLDIGKLYGVPMGLTGIELERAVTDSSYAMCALVADNFGAALFGNFFQYLDERLHFRDADLITFGVESPEGIFWALQLASWLRAAGSDAHVCIARHAWENFSLLPHVADLKKNPWFFSIISSVILYQEELPQTILGLAAFLEGGPVEGLSNVAIRIGEAVRTFSVQSSQSTEIRTAKPRYAIPAQYFEAMEMPPEHLVYCMAMVRNKCFYKKCTFCVQIAKHISDHAYSEAAEVQRALAACAELHRHHIAMINFMDEAMRPVDLRDFCAGVQARGLHIHWVGRMIAAAHPNVELLRTMKAAGCTEILFGLETFDPRLSADMGKVSKSHENAAQTTTMIETFLDAGLFVILSMIYEFPTETSAARQATLESMQQLAAKSDRFAMIFNRFHLLHESQIYKNPVAFNIQEIEQRLPENDLQYHFSYQCVHPYPPASADEIVLMQRLRLGLTAERHNAAVRQHGNNLLEMAYFLDYVSIGFEHRVQQNATLLADLLRPVGAPAAPAVLLPVASEIL